MSRTMIERLLPWTGMGLLWILAPGCDPATAPVEVESSYAEADKPIVLIHPAEDGPAGEIETIFTVEDVTQDSARGRVDVHGEEFVAEYDGLYQQPSGGTGTFLVTHTASGRNLRFLDDGLEIATGGVVRFYPDADSLSADLHLYDVVNDPAVDGLFLLASNGQVLFNAFYGTPCLLKFVVGAVIVGVVVVSACTGSEETCNGPTTVVCNLPDGTQVATPYQCGCGTSRCNLCISNTCRDECNAWVDQHALCAALGAMPEN